MEAANSIEEFQLGLLSSTSINEYESEHKFRFFYVDKIRDLNVKIVAVPLTESIPKKPSGLYYYHGLYLKFVLKKLNCKSINDAPNNLRDNSLSTYLDDNAFNHLLSFTPSNIPLMLSHKQLARVGNRVIINFSASISNCSKCGGKTPVKNKRSLTGFVCCAGVREKKSIGDIPDLWEQTVNPIVKPEQLVDGNPIAASIISKKQLKLASTLKHHPQNSVFTKSSITVKRKSTSASFQQYFLKCQAVKRARGEGELDMRYKTTSIKRTGNVLTVQSANPVRKILVTAHVCRLRKKAPLGIKKNFFRMLLATKGKKFQPKQTIQEMIDDAELSTYEYDGTFFDSLTVGIFKEGKKKYAVLDQISKTVCATCEKPGKKANAPCCENASGFFVMKSPTLHNTVHQTDVFFYDIETWQGGDQLHNFFMLSYRNPSGLIKTVYSITEFIDEIFTWVAGVNVKAKLNPLLFYEVQVVGYNSSRYDDILIEKEYQQKITSLGYKDDYTYANKAGAVIFNNLRLQNVSLKFTDVLRFTGFPISLRDAAKSFKVAVQKGQYPFGVLNDKIAKGKVELDEDGFYALSYFKGNTEERAETKAYYDLALKDKPHNMDADIFFCQRYCEDDVRSGFLVFQALTTMYNKFCWTNMLEFLNITEEQARKPVAPACVSKQGEKFERWLTKRRPELKHAAAEALLKVSQTNFKSKNRPKKKTPNLLHPFEVTRFHSMPSVAYKMSLFCAYHSTHTAINFWTGEQEEIKPGNLLITAPTGRNYEDCRKAVAGGWVGAHMRGVLVNKDEFGAYNNKKRPKIPHGPNENLMYTKEKLVMVDIVSQYPSADTGPHYIGFPVTLTNKESLEEIIALILSAESLSEIPPVMLTCSLIPPKKKFMHLTCPALRDNKNGLSWSYKAEYASEPNTYTAVDLWFGCKYLHPDDPESVWTITKPIRALVYSHSAPIYRPFVEYARQLKQQGQDEKDTCKRTAGKILLNSSIGSKGRKVETRTSVMGVENMREYVSENKDFTSLVGVTQNTALNDTEYVFKTTDVRDNKAPVHHAAVMYSYSRKLLRDITIAAGDLDVPLLEKTIPLPLYGDTDSAIITLDGFHGINDVHKQGDIGLYDKHTEFIHFNLEAEDVHKPGYNFFCLIVLARKFYALITYNREENKFLSKIKSKGHKIWKRGDPCVHHNQTDCASCTCSHQTYKFMCEYCVFSRLGDVYKTPTDEVANKLTLWEMVRAALTGIPGKVEQMRFNRNIELPTKDMGSFTIRTSNQPIQVGFAHIPGVRKGFFYFPEGSED